jgi:hypothetical protein
MNMIKATYCTWTTCLEQAWTRVPHLQTQDSSKLSHVFRCAPTRFGLVRINCAFHWVITLNYIDAALIFLFMSMQQVLFAQATPLVNHSSSHFVCFRAHLCTGHAGFLFLSLPKKSCSAPCLRQKWHKLLSCIIFSLSSGARSLKMLHLWGGGMRAHALQGSCKLAFHPSPFLCGCCSQR